MVSGVLKSRPPTSRKPQGEGPFNVTVWGMLGISTARGETDDTQTDTAAVPRYTGDKEAGVLCLAPRQRCPVGENFPRSLIQV